MNENLQNNYHTTTKNCFSFAICHLVEFIFNFFQLTLNTQHSKVEASAMLLRLHHLADSNRSRTHPQALAHPQAMEHRRVKLMGHHPETLFHTDLVHLRDRVLDQPKGTNMGLGDFLNTVHTN